MAVTGKPHFISNDYPKLIMTSIELSEEDIKTLSAVLKFSISACPLGGISQDIEIDEEKLKKLISKLEKSLS
jgi:hypothetical protein